jgi:ubiquinone/menaquinone biosynthesis C-methylase UbiE
MWSRAGNGAIVIGVESSPFMRDIAEKSNVAKDKVHLQSGDWVHTRLPNEVADMVVSRFSFHHVEKIDLAYEELARILKPKGKAVIALPHPDYCRQELIKQGKQPINRTSMTIEVLGNPISYYFHTIEDYFELDSFKKHFKIIQSKSGDWVSGTWDLQHGQTPNTLVYEIEKIA